MADKNEKKKLGDYIEISLPAYGKDQTARIWRDDVRNDAQWEHIKQEAKDSGTLVTAGKSDAKSVDSGEMLDLTDPITGAKAKMPRGNLSQSRWEALKKRDPAENQIYWDSQKDTREADPESIKRTVIDPSGRVEDVGYQAPPEVLPAEPSPTNTGRGAATTLSVDEGAATEPPVQKPMMTNPGTRTLSVDETQASGPRAFFGNAIKGAVSKEGLQYQPGALPPAPQGEISMTGLPPAQGQEPQQPLDMTGIPAGTGVDPLQAAGQIASEVPGRVKQFGQFLSDRPQEAQPGQPIAADGTRLGDPLDPAQPVPGAPPAPAPMPGSESLQVKTAATTKMPGSGGSSLEGDLNKSYKDAALALAEKSQMEALQSGKVAEAEIVKQQNLQSVENARAIRAQALVERQDKVQAAQMRAIESLSEQVKIDPSRLWSSRTSQQKADAQLAGFLFGFSGSGAQYVQSLQNEVEKDVQAQLQAVQLTMEGKKAQAAGLGNMFEQLLKQGLQTNEAAGVARASILEVHNSKLAEMKARFEGTTAGIRAGEAIAALGPARVKAIEDSRTAAAQQANLYADAYQKRESIAIQKRNAELKGKEETPMQATLSKEMAGLEDTRASLLNMKSMASGGFIERAKTQAAGAHAGVGFLAPDRKAKARTFKGEAYAQMIEKAKGALQAVEMARLSEIVPQEISAFEDPEPYFDRAIAFVEQQLARRQERYAKSGADTRGPSAGGQGGAR